MDKALLEEIKKDIIPVLMKADVKKAALFGSYVRGEQTQESDIDILIEFPKGKSLIDLVGLEMELEEALSKKVDLLTYKSISPYLKEYIENDQLQIL